MLNTPNSIKNTDNFFRLFFPNFSLTKIITFTRMPFEIGTQTSNNLILKLKNLSVCCARCISQKAQSDCRRIGFLLTSFLNKATH